MSAFWACSTIRRFLPKRACQHPRKIDDPDSLQRSRHSLAAHEFRVTGAVLLQRLQAYFQILGTPERLLQPLNRISDELERTIEAMR